MNRPKIFLALIVACGAVAAAIGLYWPLRSSPTPFDTSIWVNGESAPFTADAPRLRMADGLIDSHVLLGKPRSEIEALLGQPTKTDKFQNFDLVYWLGAERGFMSIDSEWLVVRLDSNGKAIEASIVGD